VAVATLVPEHKTLFTEAALDMQFTKSLCDDIARFALYMQHGEININTCFVFQRLQKKLLQAKPDIFNVAAQQFNVHLEFQADFDQHIRAAPIIAQRLHCEGKLDSWVMKSVSKPVSDTRPIVQRHIMPRNSGAGTGAGLSRAPRGPANTPDRRAKDAEFARLAREHHRCFRCGYFLPSGSGSVDAHKAVCTGNKDDFRSALEIKMTSVVAWAWWHLPCAAA
jgi:hypothetical protein